ncbi:hypothetical protein JWG39_15050 [Desulforhopalus vacuolatus]|uniref:hypothetical protein n=1 Tax=Desulforhopalus vacuolatus TaxID=40414 RepID=UPI0019662002|nr:hypothetical protein [Desulforhopalus vacuolatus]MBM9521138.1 hypothetical protein [Desulforhopalus vacuolatus]
MKERFVHFLGEKVKEIFEIRCFCPAGFPRRKEASACFSGLLETLLSMPSNKACCGRIAGDARRGGSYIVL